VYAAHWATVKRPRAIATWWNLSTYALVVIYCILLGFGPAFNGADLLLVSCLSFAFRSHGYGRFSSWCCRSHTARGRLYHYCRKHKMFPRIWTVCFALKGTFRTPGQLAFASLPAASLAHIFSCSGGTILVVPACAVASSCMLVSVWQGWLASDV